MFFYIFQLKNEHFLHFLVLGVSGAWVEVVKASISPWRVTQNVENVGFSMKTNVEKYGKSKKH